MSGRKQHFIPQSLLKGFGIRRGAMTQVVVYSRDRGVFTAATDGIAAERHFYSELDVGGGEETLDDRITGHESTLAGTLATFRGLTDGGAADAVEAAAFVTHLVVRNDHLRKSMTSANRAMIGSVAGMFADADSARTLLGLDGGGLSVAMEKELDEAVGRYGPAFMALGMDEAVLRSWAVETLHRDFERLHRETMADVGEVAAAILAGMPGIVADTQRRSLSEELVPQRRLERMAAYRWRVLHLDGLVLPDCVAVAILADGASCPLMLADLDAVEGVLVPISSDRMLVGSSVDDVQPPADLGAILAGCSWDFFVARERSPALVELRDGLRSIVSAYMDGLIGDAMADAVRERTARPGS